MALGLINLVAGEIFEIRGGKAHGIEAIEVLVTSGAARGRGADTRRFTKSSRWPIVAVGWMVFTAVPVK